MYDEIKQFFLIILTNFLPKKVVQPIISVPLFNVRLLHIIIRNSNIKLRNLFKLTTCAFKFNHF